MSGVVRLTTEETTFVSSETIETLRKGVAPECWSEFLEDVAFELTRDMASLERSVMLRDTSAAIAIAGRLGRSAGGVGLSDLAHVSFQMQDVLRQSDPVAVAAVLARVLRLSSVSLLALVQMEAPSETPS